MLPDEKSITKLRESFQWNIPDFFNIGVDVCDKWADVEPGRLAMVYVDPLHDVQHISFGELRSLSNQLANLLVSVGLERKDRIGILLPQMPQTAIAHIAGYKMGGVTIPLFMLFGRYSCCLVLRPCSSDYVMPVRRW